MEPVKNYLKTFQWYRSKEEILISICIVLAAVLFAWVWVTSPNTHLETPVQFTITEGQSLKQVTQSLRNEGIIKSRTISNILVMITASDAKIVSGTYLFDTPPSMFEVVERITTGDFGIETIKVRIPEGATVEQIGELFEQEFPYFEKEAFYQLAEGKEGYLFPDTYLFLETVKAHEVLAKLQDTFSERTAELIPLLKESGRSLEEVVIMASIVEKEATAESRQEVADILWKRIAIEMPLQVDATFVYSIGKGTFDLYKADLRDEENPYNTYVHLGLPPTAISNPSFEAMKAAATSQDTDYLFFLTGHDGEMYYAEDFDGHKENRRRFLN